MNKNYIQIDNLSKSYGFNKVLNGIDLHFDKGDFVAIFGPNGAGKTTLIKILTTILKADGGSVSISGLDIRKEVQSIRKIIGLLSHESFLYANLTVFENLKFFARLYGITNYNESIKYKLDTIGLYSKRNEYIRNLSSGMKQRASILRSLVHDPEIVFLDEPFVGLDIEGAEYLLGIFKEFKKENITALVTTHDITLGLKECTKVVVMNKGRIKFNEISDNIEGTDFEGTYKSLIS